MVLNINIESKSNMLFGRDKGMTYNINNNILENIKSGNTFKIKVSDNISYISDSFWKGFLVEAFKEYKTKDKILSFFTFDTSENIKEDLDENIKILDEIFNY